MNPRKPFGVAFEVTHARPFTWLTRGHVDLAGLMLLMAVAAFFLA
jgi:hypothetical protein